MRSKTFRYAAASNGRSNEEMKKVCEQCNGGESCKPGFLITQNCKQVSVKRTEKNKCCVYKSNILHLIGVVKLWYWYGAVNNVLLFYNL